jgi:16S rRNA (uracil1498-N3)-methyltransferase
MHTPADVDSKAHVLVGDITATTLADAHHHHLGRVLRLRSGDCITTTDGKGTWRQARLGTGWPNRADVEWGGETSFVARRERPISVGFALTKAEKPETVVQKLAELGIDRVVPFTAERSVARWDSEKASRNVARLRTIAAEALQQSRQVWLTEIASLTTVAELAKQENVDLYGTPTRADRGGISLLESDAHFVLVGPEGGWSAGERALLPGSVGIAPSVLRAETAAIVAGALLVARLGN